MHDLDMYEADLRFNIPKEMQEVRRWTGYTVVEEDGEIKKKPVNLRTLTAAEWQKSENLLSMQEALSYLGTEVNAYRKTVTVNYLGFVTGAGWFCIDLDNHDSGETPEDLEEAIKVFDGAYQETSYSGNGRHIIAKYFGDSLGIKPSQESPYCGKIELYTDTHGIVITGDTKTQPQAAAELQEFTSQVKDIHNRFIAAPKPAKITPSSGVRKQEGQWSQEESHRYLEENIDDILSHISPNLPRDGGPGNPSWVKVGAALNYEGFSIDLFDSWSKNGEHYKGREDIEATWRTFNQSTANPVTGKFLIKMAEDGGWKPPRPSWVTESKSDPTSKVKPADLSDAGNAAVFARWAKLRVLWSSALGWLYWDGQHWDPDAETVKGIAIDLSREMLQDAFLEYRNGQNMGEDGKIAVADSAKMYLQHARKTRSKTSIFNFLELSKPALQVNADDLDSDPYKLNTPGGLVDLKTGSIAPSNPADLCTRMTACSVSDEGKGLWLDFLKLVTSNDAELQKYLQYAIGSMLIGKPIEGVWIAVGGGRNGKSTFYNAISAVLGSYAGSIDSTILTTDRQNRGAALATLRGRRFVTCGELEEGQRLSVQTLKRLASTDLLTIEEKYRQPETIKPSHHISLFSNFLPRVGSTDNGTWRRIWVIPFNATMPEGDRDIPDYASVLFENAGGAILSWAIEGATLFIKSRSHLPKCAAVQAASDAYRQRENWINLFLSECCTKENASHKVRAGILYNAYKKFAQDSGDYVRRLADFNAAMENAGFKQQTEGGHRTNWLGLSINQEYARDYSWEEF